MAWLPEIEGWVKLAGAAVAVVMAVLVPIRSWIAEDRRHHAQALEALSAAGRAGTARPLATAPQLLADSLALGAVAEGLRDLAEALRDLTARRDAVSDEQLLRALSAILDEASDR